MEKSISLAAIIFMSSCTSASKPQPPQDYSPVQDGMIEDLYWKTQGEFPDYLKRKDQP